MQVTVWWWYYSPKPMFKAIGDRLVVEPYYDADKIGSLYIPDAFKNPEAQQGVIKSAGPLTSMCEGSYVFFPPFRSQPIQGTGLISIKDKDVVAFLVDGEMYPPWEHVQIAPDWDSKYGYKGLVQLTAPIEGEYSPVKFGTIIRVAEGVENVSLGQKVVIAPGAGHEIGYDGSVTYFIHERDLLATVDATDH